jgi:3-hydroxyisobutyrate dehydrogenase-like beta-hydroxyacid dehydrogenase
MTVGFIGLGEMGAPMARSLIAAGHVVYGHDKRAEAIEAVPGAHYAIDASEAIGCPVVLTSLPSSEIWMEFAWQQLVPQAKPGQLIIDLGTSVAYETEAIAQALAQRGADFIDSPVSGGVYGAERRQLRMFVGAHPEVFLRARPILASMGGEEHITHCGPPGAGQKVKGVNQLAMGLGIAAYVEAVAYAVRQGIDPSLIHTAVGGHGGTADWRAMVDRVAQAAATGQAEELGVKFRELPYYLQDAQHVGQALPLTEALYQFCENGERVVIDDHRPAPSFWHELIKGS